MLKFFKKNNYLILFVLILILSFGLRFYKLGVVPHGMTWDEAAIGYNGYAVLTTRRDEWLFKLPFSFRSFGDYKAPFAIYLNGLFTYLFGMNLWAVRLPFAMAGVLSVAGFVLLLKNLYKKNKNLSLLGGLLLATSPWHLHFSRAGFESGLALCFIIWGFYFFIKFLNSKKFLNLIFFVSVWVLAIYSYHSAKIFLPLFAFVLFILFAKNILKNKLKIFISLILGLILLGPFIYDSFFAQGLERAGTLIFSQSNNIFKLIILFLKQYLIHLSPKFLLLGETTTLRHGAGAWGVFLPSSLFLILFAFILIKKNKKIFSLGLAWALIGLISAALGTDGVPHQNRALLALPGFLILATLGFKNLYKFIKNLKINKKLKSSHGKKNVFIKIMTGIWAVAYLLIFITYLNYYYVDFAKNSATDFQDGYLEAFDYIKINNFEKTKNKIIFTSEYGQPYIYALFAKKTNPIWYQGGSLINYEFKDANIGDLVRENAVIFAGQNAEFLKAEEADYLIYGSDGKVRFKVFITD